MLITCVIVILHSIQKFMWTFLTCNIHRFIPTQWLFFATLFAKGRGWLANTSFYAPTNKQNTRVKLSMHKQLIFLKPMNLRNLKISNFSFRKNVHENLKRWSMKYITPPIEILLVLSNTSKQTSSYDSLDLESYSLYGNWCICQIDSFRI